MLEYCWEEGRKMKKIIHHISIAITILLLLFITYQISYHLACLGGIHTKAIGSIAMAGELRGDWFLFRGFCSLLLLIGCFLMGNPKLHFKTK